MIQFLDGPAAGVKLMLRRAPVMLRVVRAGDGTWDALDQLEDEPAIGEDIFVYQLATYPSGFHIRCARGSKTPSGFYMTAEYRLYPEQPGDEHTRTNAAWATWNDSIIDEVANHHRALKGGAA